MGALSNLKLELVSKAEGLESELEAMRSEAAEKLADSMYSTKDLKHKLAVWEEVIEAHPNKEEPFQAYDSEYAASAAVPPDDGMAGKEEKAKQGEGDKDGQKEELWHDKELEQLDEEMGFSFRQK
eukprot:7933288-Pyramimonas_sp.AAC.1